MSLAAYMWAADLPLNACTPTAFRVLLKYADRADELGYNAWHTEEYLADVLGCSTRTIRRVRLELVELGLMRRATDRVADIKGRHAGHRPQVYDVLTFALKAHEASGGTFVANRPGYGGTRRAKMSGHLLSIETAHKPTTKTSPVTHQSNRERAYGRDAS